MTAGNNDRIALTVVVPALNEEKSIELAISNCLRAMDDFGISGEVLVVNDGSRDRTSEIMHAYAAKDPRVRVVDHEKPRGIGASFWEGVDNGRGEYIIMLPGDNENDPWEILQYHGLLNSVDMVIPFVFNKETRSIFRNALSFLYRFIINTTFLVYFNYTNGTVIYRRAVLRELEFRSSGFFFQTDMLIRLAKKGYLFAEVPYRLGVRKGSVSKAVSFPSLMRVIKGYLKLVRDCYVTRRVRSGEHHGESVTFARRAQEKNERFVESAE